MSKIKVLRPKNDRVLVKPVEMGDQFHGTILVPDMGKEKPILGEVLEVGPGRISEFSGAWVAPTCSKGDVILIPKAGAIRVEFEGEEYLFVTDKEILGIITEVESN